METDLIKKYQLEMKVTLKQGDFSARKVLLAKMWNLVAEGAIKHEDVYKIYFAIMPPMAT